MADRPTLEAPEVAALIDQLGSFFEQFGIKRNVGRVWAAVYLSPEPVSQTDIVQQMGLSTGLVNAAVHELEHWGALRVVRVRGSRRIHYVAEENLLHIGATILRKRELEAVRQLKARAREARLAPVPLGDPLRKRLARIEQAMVVTESLLELVGRLAAVPRKALPLAAGVLGRARFLDGLRVRSRSSEAPEG